MELIEESQSIEDLLKTIDPYEFEGFIAELWDRDGWTTEVSTASGDGGRDVIAIQQGTVRQKQLIECKRHTHPIGPSAVREYAGVREREIDADQMVIVTTSRFTDGAKVEAHDLNVKLVESEDLARMIERLDAVDLLREYANPDENTESSANADSRSVPDIDLGAGSHTTAHSIIITTLIVMFFVGVTAAIPDSIISAGGSPTLILLGLGLVTVLVYVDAVNAAENQANWQPHKILWPAATVLTLGLASLYYILKRREMG